MSISLISKNNSEECEADFPNGFWPAFCCETPVSQLLSCHYKPETDERVIVYDHEGYVGGWIEESIAKSMLSALEEYIKTDDFKNHRYFGSRSNQMDSAIEFLRVSGEFRVQ